MPFNYHNLLAMIRNKHNSAPLLAVAIEDELGLYRNMYRSLTGIAIFNARTVPLKT